MQLLGGQLITFNSIFKLAKLLCQEQKKKGKMMDITGRTKPPWELAKAGFLLSQSCICLLAALLLSCWETNQDYTVISKSMSLVAYKNDRENCVSESKAKVLCKSVILHKRLLGHQALCFLIWSCISCGFHVLSPAAPRIWLVTCLTRSKVSSLLCVEEYQTLCGIKPKEVLVTNWCFQEYHLGNKALL